MLSDLVFVLRRIEKILDEHKLHELYQKFATILLQVASSSTPELQEQLKDCKEDIKIVHQKIDTSDWSRSQLQIFKGFGAENVLGPEGYNRFLKALSDNSANAPGAIEEINKQKDEISQLLTKAATILTSLGGLAEEKKLEEGQSVVQIVFDEDVSIETLPDLSKRAAEWEDIIRAYSLFAGEAPEKTRIIATSKESPYTVWLATAQFVGETLCATIKPFIELYKKVLEAKEHALVLEDMRVGIEDKKFNLFKKIDEYERVRVTEIVEDIAVINNTKGISEGDKNEGKNALRLLGAGPKLYAFITKGGKVDVSKKSEDKKVFSNFQLESKYKVTDQLKVDVQKLLVARSQTVKTKGRSSKKESLKGKKRGIHRKETRRGSVKAKISRAEIKVEEKKV